MLNQFTLVILINCVGHLFGQVPFSLIISEDVVPKASHFLSKLLPREPDLLIDPNLHVETQTSTMPGYEPLHQGPMVTPKMAFKRKKSRLPPSILAYLNTLKARKAQREAKTIPAELVEFATEILAKLGPEFFGLLVQKFKEVVETNDDLNELYGLIKEYVHAAANEEKAKMHALSAAFVTKLDKRKVNALGKVAIVFINDLNKVGRERVSKVIKYVMEQFGKKKRLIQALSDMVSKGDIRMTKAGEVKFKDTDDIMSEAVKTAREALDKLDPKVLADWISRSKILSALDDQLTQDFMRVVHKEWVPKLEDGDLKCLTEMKKVVLDNLSPGEKAKLESFQAKVKELSKSSPEISIQ